MRRVDAYQVDILFTIALALGGYVLADALHLSAPLEAVVAGIAMRHFNRHQPDERIDHEQVNRLLGGDRRNPELACSSSCLVLKSWPSPSMHRRFGAGLGGHPLRQPGPPWRRRAAAVRWCASSSRTTAVPLFVLTWGGLRGGLSIALALSVPEAFGRSWILGATYVVVVFSIVFQGGSMDWHPALEKPQDRRLIS